MREIRTILTWDNTTMILVLTLGFYCVCLRSGYPKSVVIWKDLNNVLWVCAFSNKELQWLCTYRICLVTPCQFGLSFMLQQICRCSYQHLILWINRAYMEFSSKNCDRCLIADKPHFWLPKCLSSPVFWWNGIAALLRPSNWVHGHEDHDY